MNSPRRNLLAILLSIMCGLFPAGASVLIGPVVNPANGHRYLLLEQSTWKAANEEAIQRGGYLAAIESESENAWLVATFGNFGGTPRHLWIGYTDEGTEGSFRWVNGQSSTFSRWAVSEPNNASGEHYAELLGGDGLQSSAFVGQWNDLPDAPGYPVFGIVELSEVSGPIANWIGWGAGGEGQSGEPHFGQSIFPQSPEEVLDVSPGVEHNAVLRNGGTIYCWGRNDHGQCDVPAGLKRVKQVGAGHQYTLALLYDGSLAHWGFGGYGMRPIPPEATNLVAVAAGYSHCLALRADGSVLAWGYNGLGQTNVPIGLSNVVAIAAGDAVSAALRNDGTIITWGIAGTVPPEGLGPVREIACGSAHIVALLRNGTVAAWGNPSAPTAVIVPTGLTNVIHVGAGIGWSIALRANGSLIAWGDGAEPDRLTYGQTIIPKDLGEVRRVRAGAYHAIAERGNPQSILSRDTDGDAFLDGMEFVFGTDHRDPSSFPPFPVFHSRSLQLEASGDFRIRLSVPSNGSLLTIETSSDFSVWTPLVSFPAPRSDLEFVDPAADESPRRYYRAEFKP